MTITNDGTNYFLGTAIYSQGSQSLQGFGVNQGTGIVDELQDLFTQSGIRFRNDGFVLQANATDDGSNSATLCRFGFNSDPQLLDDRIKFAYLDGLFGTDVGSYSTIAYFNNAGDTGSGGTISTGTALFGLGSNGEMETSGVVRNLAINLTPDYSGLNFLATSDGESLGIFYWGYDDGTPSFSNLKFRFQYAGRLDPVNPNYNYYSSSQENFTVVMTNCKDSTNMSTRGFYVGHYIESTAKNALETGDGDYAITCSDAQTPSGQWGTDFYVFDDNSSLGNPSLGKVRNMLLADGTYQIGEVVSIIGGVTPDAGNNKWLCVGQWGSKYAFMRVG